MLIFPSQADCCLKIKEVDEYISIYYEVDNYQLQTFLVGKKNVKTIVFKHIVIQFQLT